MLSNVCVKVEYSIVDVMTVNVKIINGVIAEDKALANYITLTFSLPSHTRVK